jgi:endogenous inhibitor of DNA gyrase (YacG/DUF329 family)
MPDKYTAQNSILINCSLCGKEFSRSLSEYRRGSDSRFCCIVCRNRSLALDKLNKRIPCPICGKPFYAGSRNQKKTCSIGFDILPTDKSGGFLYANALRWFSLRWDLLLTAVAVLSLTVPP